MTSASVIEAHLCIARPSNSLAALLPFYCRGLGFSELYEFSDHDGFDGVMLGCQGSPYHLKITYKPGHGLKMGRAPSQVNLLVFYVPDADDWKAAVDRMTNTGYHPVSAYNSYWDVRGKTFEDQMGIAWFCSVLDGPLKAESLLARQAQRRPSG